MPLRVRRPRWLRIPTRRPSDGGPSGPSEPSDGKALTLTGHLVELRNRIYISVLSLLPGTVLGYVFGNEIVRVLIAPLPTDHLVALGLTEPFMIKLQIAVVCGVIVGMPVMP